jgi:hypothetical protein
MKSKRFFFFVLFASLTWGAISARADILDFIPAIIAASQPARPPCAEQIPVEPTADGDYRSYVSPIETSSTNPRVAMARNGWRTLVLSDNGLDVFERGSNTPLAHVAVNEPYTATFSLAHDGSVFALGDTLAGSARLRYFECGVMSPLWTWVSNGGSWPKVALDAKGRWIAIATNNPENLTLFRRDRHSGGVGTPVFSKGFDSQYPIRAMAFSGNGPYAAVITSSHFDDQYTLHLIGRNGIRWSSVLEGSRWAIPDGIFMDMSTDGRYIVVGGFGGLLRFFSTQSATPVWTIPIASSSEQDSYIHDVAISQNGGSIAFVYTKYDPSHHGIIQYIHDTSTRPNLSETGNWSWAGNETFSWTDIGPYPTPKANITPYFLNAFYLQSVAISEDGQYVFVSGYFNYQVEGVFQEGLTAGMTFHRDSSDPLRIYLSGDQGVADRTGAISPDGSWVAMAGETNVARFEAAPVEKVNCSQPIVADIPVIGTPLGLGKVKIDYTIYKTGRASKVRQYWDLYALPFGVLLGDMYACIGDSTFEYPLLVSAGNAVLRGTREIDLPSCILGYMSGIEGFELDSTLKNDSGQVSYSKDETAVVQLTITE